MLLQLPFFQRFSPLRMGRGCYQAVLALMIKGASVGRKGASADAAVLSAGLGGEGHMMLV